MQRITKQSIVIETHSSRDNPAGLTETFETDQHEWTRLCRFVSSLQLSPDSQAEGQPWPFHGNHVGITVTYTDGSNITVGAVGIPEAFEPPELWAAVRTIEGVAFAYIR